MEISGRTEVEGLNGLKIGMVLVIHRSGKPNSLVCRRHARIGVFGGVGVSSKAIVNYAYHANPPSQGV